METTLDSSHEQFHTEALKLLANHSAEQEVFQELWIRQEYRIAYQYLHEEMIRTKKVIPGSAFSAADAAFYLRFIQNY
jgi:hypothetical protein